MRLSSPLSEYIDGYYAEARLAVTLAESQVLALRVKLALSESLKRQFQQCGQILPPDRVWLLPAPCWTDPDDPAADPKDKATRTLLPPGKLNVAFLKLVIEHGLIRRHGKQLDSSWFATEAKIRLANSGIVQHKRRLYDHAVAVEFAETPPRSHTWRQYALEGCPPAKRRRHCRGWEPAPLLPRAEPPRHPRQHAQ